MEEEGSGEVDREWGVVVVMVVGDNGGIDDEIGREGCGKRGGGEEEVEDRVVAKKRGPVILAVVGDEGADRV